VTVKSPTVATTTEEEDSQASPTVIRNSRSNLRVTKAFGGKSAANALMSHPNRMVASPTFMAPDLVPLCRVLVSSTLALFNGVAAIDQGTTTYVCDPTGVATNSLGVFQWSTRFSGFQQYRVRSTKWVLTPLRTKTAVDTAIAGYAIAFIEDDPQAGAPSQAVALASYPRARVIFNSEKISTIDYGTNEPTDLDLSDINTPPTKIVGTSINQGQHCLNLYTDNGFFGLNFITSSGTFPLIGVQAIYDIEFFGIGGV